MSEQPDYSPEDLSTGMVCLPKETVEEIIHQFEERVSDGYIAPEQLEYYQNVIQIFNLLLEASQEDRVYIFNYAPMDFPEDTDESINQLMFPEEGDHETGTHDSG